MNQDLKILIYNDEANDIRVETHFTEDTIWLTQKQIVELFQTAKSTVSEHIKNIYNDGELTPNTTVRNIRTVQNKLHFAAHGHTASEVIYLRVDSDKPFAGLTSFKGEQPTQAEAMIAKNYLSEKELKVLNNLVSAYFDLAELNAIEEKVMNMVDFVQELDTILSSTNRKLLENAGKISTSKAKEKATKEYKKYKAKTLDNVEKAYLKTITSLEKKAKKESRKK